MNWKTTIAGLLAAALQMFANGTNWKSVLAATSVAAIGVLAKDSDNHSKPPE